MSQVFAMGGGKQIPSATSPKVRDSQMELLRIVAMSMILIHHFVVHASGYNIIKQGLGLQNAFVYYGVDLFVMLSGYYGIKIRWRSFFSLVLTLVFFSLVNIIAVVIFPYIFYGEVVAFTFADLSNAFIKPFKPWWFISCYMMLYMVAPLLNLGLKAASKVQLRTIVVILVAYMVYGGLINDATTQAGRGFAAFLMLYVLGYWIAEENPFRRLSSITLIAIAILSSLVIGTSPWILFTSESVGIGYSTSYISVFLLAGAVAIFIVFSRMKIRSRLINAIATAALGCYLIQDGVFGYGFLYQWQLTWCATHPFAESLLMYATSFVGLWVASWVLTRFKNLWAPRLIDAVYRVLPQRWKQAVW